MCIAYVFIDGQFMKDVATGEMTDPLRIAARFAGHFLVALISIPAGAIVGLIFFGLVCLSGLMSGSSERYSFPVFILIGMVTYMVLIFGGGCYLKSESGREWIQSLKAEAVRKDFEKNSPMVKMSASLKTSKNTSDQSTSATSFVGTIKNESPKSLKKLTVMVTVLDSAGATFGGVHFIEIERVVVSGETKEFSVFVSDISIPKDGSWMFFMSAGEFF